MSKRVVVVGKNVEMTRVVERVLNKMEDYTGLACFELDELKRILPKEQFDILLIGTGFSARDEKLLQEEAVKIQPQIKIVVHFGGGSGLLLSELKSVEDA
jgi:hypothetical protein